MILLLLFSSHACACVIRNFIIFGKSKTTLLISWLENSTTLNHFHVVWGFQVCYLISLIALIQSHRKDDTSGDLDEGGCNVKICRRRGCSIQELGVASKNWV